MSALIGGIIAIILGAVGFLAWWCDFLIIIKGSLPLLLILGGVAAVYMSLDTIQGRMKEERQKQEEQLEKARLDIEHVKAQSEQYREELERLKEQSKENTP